VDALTLLKKDHDEVKKLLNDLHHTTDRAIKTSSTRRRSGPSASR
jgi:hypothetical protein